MNKNSLPIVDKIIDPSCESLRSFIKFCTLSSVGALVAVPNVAEALSFYSTKEVEGIQDEWVRKKGVNVLRYANFIQKLRLKRVEAADVIAPHFKNIGNVYNEIPRSSMWRRIAHTLRVVDAASVRLRPDKIVFYSVYRSPRYNRRCGGKTKSLHMQNRAIDLAFKGVSSYRVAREFERIRRSKMFRGGIGRYNSFTHIDTRGINCDWNG